MERYRSAALSRAPLIRGKRYKRAEMRFGKLAEDIT
jgi:hypothetical protein